MRPAAAIRLIRPRGRPCYPRSVVVDTLELNPTLDIAAFADAFARSRVVQIPAVFTAASAERLYRALSLETPWVLSHNMDGARTEVPSPTPGDRMKLALQSYSRARENFAHFYDRHELTRDGAPYASPGHAFAGLVALLKAPEFIALLRRVTGMDAVSLADAEATLFRPGDYLTRQEGTEQDQSRLAGYVLSMTPAWRLDWGGILEFVSGAGHVARGYVPTFNTLTVFAVPRAHFVSQVALHGGLRYSVSGWLRSS